MSSAFHHVELWTADLKTAEHEWRWLLDAIGWGEGDTWAQGRTWTHADGSYLVLEQSPDLHGTLHDRLRPGLNHLAFNAGQTAALDALRMTAHEHGWQELFADKYPHAGGPTHTALFLENTEGFEVELVASPE